MQIQFVILAIFMAVLRRYLRGKKQLPQLQRYLVGGIVACFVIMFFEVRFPGILPYVGWIGYAAILGLFWLVFKNPVFKSLKSQVYIVLPLIAVELLKSIAKMISPGFYQTSKNYFEVAGLFAFAWMMVMVFINNRQRKALALQQRKAEEQERELRLTEKMKAELEIQVAERTAELTQQKHSLEQAILDLKATQTQLIQAEKMASLGELTAGIAHEIQNPLNFVNNFSELNKDLILEMKEELDRGNLDDVRAIADSIGSNEEKITFHGKRADGIVKGMLQHSRTSSGQKEPTDINELCDEYLRLAYHGLRAKDKSFNASFETSFDEDLPKINVVPQDIGRVLLNLINNAFYAVSEKRKKAGDDYKPTVVVSTKSIIRDQEKFVEVCVKDNGDGIPAEIREKIFQPFFTTKPTGKGTGLGLSLSYDIVRAHDGQIKVESEINAGTTFIIKLPA